MSGDLEARVLKLEQIIDSLPGGRAAATNIQAVQALRESQVVYVSQAPTTIDVLTCIHTLGFSSYRHARETLEAIALCHGVTLVGTKFPFEWAEKLEQIRHHRKNGFTWRESLERAVLTPTSNIRDAALEVARETERLETVLQAIAAKTLEICPENLLENYQKSLEPLLES